MKKKSIGLALVVLALLITVSGIVLWIAFSGEFVNRSVDPSIHALQTYINELPDVSRIEVIYRPSREWIDEPDSSAEYEEITLTITETAEIQQIMDGFVNAERFAPYWTRCGFYIKLNLYNSESHVGTLLVGFDDCKSFTTADIHAVGTMANDYFHKEYVMPLVNPSYDN